MGKKSNNTIIIAEKVDYTKNNYNIYMIFSGKKEFLMSHRDDRFLYPVLKEGITLNELRWNKPVKIYSSRGINVNKHVAKEVYGTFNHIIKVVDSYIKEIEMDYTPEIENAEIYNLGI
ncbi:MAG: hypothetical protein K6E10_01390 [Eubacterium sp.]|nr:hypothetical protein [Eubacterium sp.]